MRALPPGPGEAGFIADLCTRVADPTGPGLTRGNESESYAGTDDFGMYPAGTGLV